VRATIKAIRDRITVAEKTLHDMGATHEKTKKLQNIFNELATKARV
jgi:hypothetical protein